MQVEKVDAQYSPNPKRYGICSTEKEKDCGSFKPPLYPSYPGEIWELESFPAFV